MLNIFHTNHLNNIYPICSPQPCLLAMTDMDNNSPHLHTALPGFLQGCQVTDTCIASISSICLSAILSDGFDFKHSFCESCSADAIRRFGNRVIQIQFVGFHVSGIVPENEFSPSCRAVRSRGVSLARGKSGFCNSGLLVGGEVCSIPAILGGTPLL